METTTLAIADGQPAIRHIEAAIDAGCHAVTANKGPVAFAYRRLRDRAAAAGVSFLFEGAVMDGVPVFNLVRETMPAVTVRGFRGVVNSTTNHILTALEDGEAFAPALARMQAEGIAEADPSLDVDGWDAAAKAAALANVLMDAELTPHLVERTRHRPGDGGAGPERAARVAHASASSPRPAATIAVASSPRFGRWSCRSRICLSGLRGTANALILHTDLLGDVAIHQLGGGLTMTAYALLSDLIAIRRRAWLTEVRRRESQARWWLPSPAEALPLEKRRQLPEQKGEDVFVGEILDGNVFLDRALGRDLPASPGRGWCGRSRREDRSWYRARARCSPRRSIRRPGAPSPPA